MIKSILKDTWYCYFLLLWWSLQYLISEFDTFYNSFILQFHWSLLAVNKKNVNASVVSFSLLTPLFIKYVYHLRSWLLLTNPDFILLIISAQLYRQNDHWEDQAYLTLLRNKILKFLIAVLSSHSISPKSDKYEGIAFTKMLIRNVNHHSQSTIYKGLREMIFLAREIYEL